MKIASLFASLKVGGGVEKIQANLSLGLCDLGYEFIHLVMEETQPINEYAGILHNFNMKFVSGFGIKKIFSLFQLAWNVKKYCEKKHIDILIGQGDFFFMVTGLSKLFGNRAKIIAVVHTSIGVWPWYITKIMNFFLKQHDHIVMTSHQEMNTFITQYNYTKDKLSLIYNSIDSKNLIRQSNELLPSKYSPIFNNGKKTFINVARLNYQKNQKLLIEAFSKIDNKNTQLLLVGEGEERKNLEELIHQLSLQKRVFLLGNQQNTHMFVSRSDYWVLSSRFEGFPMVLIEAGILGKSIIAIDCPTGPREFLDPFGKQGTIEGFVLADNGILVRFDEDNPEYLTSAMDYVLNHSLTTQQKNVQYYCQKFDNKINAKQWGKLITSL